VTRILATHAVDEDLVKQLLKQVRFTVIQHCLRSLFPCCSSIFWC